jgi:hypothetical protein
MFIPSGILSIDSLNLKRPVFSDKKDFTYLTIEKFGPFFCPLFALSANDSFFAMFPPDFQNLFLKAVANLNFKIRETMIYSN